VTSQLGPEPAYCTIHLGRPLTPTQWMTCWKYGWDEPTSRIAYDFGHNVLPVLIILAVIAFLVMRSTRRTLS
jgi:hypothetical protein